MLFKPKLGLFSFFFEYLWDRAWLRSPRQVFQIVAFGRLIVTAAHGCGLLRRWRGATTLRLLGFLCCRRVRSVSTFFAFFAAGEVDYSICGNFQTCSSYTGLVSPFTSRQSTVNEDLCPASYAVCDVFGLLAPNRDIEPLSLFLPLVVDLVPAIYRHAEARDSTTICGVAKFGVASCIAD